MIYAEPSAEGLYTRMGAIRIGEGTFYTNAYRSLRRALRLTRVTAAPDVVASRGDASKDGLRSDGCQDRPLHAELKLFAENPALRARAPRQSCTGLIEAHGKQFFIAALEEVGSLGIVSWLSLRRCEGANPRLVTLGRTVGRMSSSHRLLSGRGTASRLPSSARRPRPQALEMAGAFQSPWGQSASRPRLNGFRLRASCWPCQPPCWPCLSQRIWPFPLFAVLCP